MKSLKYRMYAHCHRISAVPPGLMSSWQNMDSESSGPSALTSHWANIEEHLKKHDENFVRKYNSDMDTLLVFVSALSLYA